MVLTTPHTYLDEEDIRRATEEVDQAAVTGMVLEGTLDEIMARVIDGVLREEGGNASRAAKRLGIGRSTLWRRMKMA